MYSKLDLLPDSKLDRYMLTFIIPFLTVLSGLLWFEYINTFSIIAMAIIFLLGEFYFSKVLEKHHRQSALFIDVVIVLFILSQHFI